MAGGPLVKSSGALPELGARLGMMIGFVYAQATNSAALMRSNFILNSSDD